MFTAAWEDEQEERGRVFVFAPASEGKERSSLETSSFPHNISHSRVYPDYS